MTDYAHSVEARGEDAVGHGTGGDIRNSNDQGNGDGNGGGVAWERVTKKRKSEMSGNEMFIHIKMRIRWTRMMMKARGNDDNPEDSYNSNNKDVGRGQGQ